MFQKQLLIVVGALVVGTFNPACATKKFVLQRVDKVDASVQATDQKLSKRLDSHDSDIQANAGQIGELVANNKENRQKLDAVKNDVQTVDGKATAAGQAADEARKAADLAGTSIAGLDNKFQNRNRYNLLTEKVVEFKFGDWKLPKAETSDLDEAARLLKDDPDVVAVLAGRTDSVGNKDYNIQLGQKRLEAVARYLIVEKDVPAYKIHKMSFGPDKPIADNSTKAGRSKNRSAVVSIYAPQSKATTQTSSR